MVASSYSYKSTATVVSSPVILSFDGNGIQSKSKNERQQVDSWCRLLLHNDKHANRIQRVLVVAVLFVSSLQFIVFDPTAVIDIESTHTTKTKIAANNNSTSISESTTMQQQKMVNNSTPIIDVSTNRDISAVSAAATAANIDVDPTITKTNQQHKSKQLQFCGSCNFNPENSCNQRLKYIMDRYQTPLDEAKHSILDRCGVDMDNEPYVLLHAGPHKTGTTSIQSFLYKSLWENATYLQQDKFAVPTYDDLPGAFGGDGPMLNFAHCMLANFVKDGGQMNVAMCNNIRGKNATFVNFLKRNYEAGRHVLLVAEDLDRLTIDYGRVQHYLRPYRRFKVVVTYRRMHDWLPSWYNQIVELYLARYISGEDYYP